MKCPVVPLVKAVYGHPDSGGYWEDHCDTHIKAHGFVPVPGWWSCYTHKTLDVFLTVYVDDFKMSGKRNDVKEAWKLISTKSTLIDKGIALEEPGPVDRYLGCHHVTGVGWVNELGDLRSTKTDGY